MAFNKNDEMKIISTFDYLDKMKIAEERKLIDTDIRESLRLSAEKYLKEQLTLEDKNKVITELNDFAIYNYCNMNTVIAWYMWKTNFPYKNLRKSVNNLAYDYLKNYPFLSQIDEFTGEEEYFENLRKSEFTTEEIIIFVKIKTIFYVRFNSKFASKAKDIRDIIMEILRCGVVHMGDMNNYIGSVVSSSKAKQTLSLNNAVNLISNTLNNYDIEDTIEDYEAEILRLEEEIKELI